MPPQFTPTTYIESRSYYLSPRTGMVISLAKAKRLKLKPTTFIYLRDADTKRIMERVRLTKVESILPVKNFQDRSIWQSLTTHRVWSRLWANPVGEIRVTVSGIADGKRVKQVLHLPYHKGHWAFQHSFRRSGKKKIRVEGRTMFKEFVVARISSMLRRRRLRVSNQKESQRRIDGLQRNLEGMELMTEFVTPAKMGGHIQRIKWAAEAIKQQKRTRQLTQATIKVEKLA